MNYEEIIEEIRLTLTGGIIDLGLDDKTLKQVINKALRELNGYCDETKLITVPFSKCIDLSGFNVRYVSNVYRTDAVGSGTSGQTSSSYINSSNGISDVDPMMANWYIYSNGYSMYNLNDWVLNYSAYNVLNQIENTISTDLAFTYEDENNKLYVNTVDSPSYITIRYVPMFKDPSELKEDYWIDILLQLSIAYTKIILGRIRSRYNLNNGLWSGDGATLLEEGNEELTRLQEILRANRKVTLPKD